MKRTLLSLALLAVPAVAQSGASRPVDAHQTSPNGTDAATPPGNGGATITPNHNYYEAPDNARPHQYNFGWIGLLGLAGFAGRLRRRISSPEIEHRTTPRSQPEGNRRQ